jgi:hypothetical protein
MIHRQIASDLLKRLHEKTDKLHIKLVYSIARLSR